MNIPLEAAIPANAAAITALGLLQLFWGYRYYRLLIVFYAFPLGAMIGALLGGWLFPGQPMLVYLLALAGVGILVPFMYFISLFCVGLVTSGGIVLALSLLVLMLAGGNPLSPTALWTLGILTALGGLAGGILAVIYHRGVIIVLTSLFGAIMGVAAAAMVGGTSYLTTTQPHMPAAWHIAAAVAVVLALTIVGIIVQRKTNPAEAARSSAKRRSPATAAAA
jgi:hypothetical protein